VTAAARAAAEGDLPLQVILGPCDDMRAEVFVRVALPTATRQSLQLEGEIIGPECRRSITLPAGASLIDLGPGEAGLLAKVVLTEPAFWTPELPNLYRLTARLVADGQAVAATSRRIGLRRSGVRGRSLWLEGRRWVPRGIACDPQSCDLAIMRDASVAAVVADPPESLLAAADDSGVAIIAVAEMESGWPLDADALVERIARWAMHPSVVLTILPRAFTDAQLAAVAANARRLKGTMLLASVVAAASPPPSGVPAGIDCLCVALGASGLPHDAWREAAPTVPLIAWRRGGDEENAGRSGCDRLQAAVAAWGLAAGRMHQPWDWAGYLVS
jgi:hypothetical protein